MEREQEHQYDVSFYSPSHFHIELHFSMLEDYTSNAQSMVMKKVWEYFEPKQGCTSELMMRDEMFYFYHIAHMAKHFRLGGCGIRTILDQWLLNHKTSFEQSKRDVLIEKGGLTTFDRKVKELSEIWFSNKDKNEELADFEDYIIHGGIFGTTEQNITVTKTETNNRFVYYFKRVFQPYNSLKNSYPVLKKCSVLLPLFWIVRWCKLINPAVRKRVATEIKIERSVDKLKVIELNI